MYFIKIDNFINNDQKKRKILYNSYFWDKWIGEQDFDIDFLNKIFCNYNNYNIVFMCKNLSKNINSIIGIMVYKKLYTTNNKNCYELSLIAKQKNSIYKKIGEKYIEYLKNHFKNCNFVLIDDSEILNYYSKLGFTKLKNLKLVKYKNILNTYKNEIYELIF